MDSSTSGHELVMDASNLVQESDEVGELRAEVLELSVALARTEEQLAVTKAAATAEIEAMRAQVATQIAARNTVIEQLRQNVQYERAERTKLAAELAEARKE
jgi:hypothetical protein